MYLLDSGRDCGGDEYEAVLFVGSSNRRKKIGLHSTDLRNGLSVFHFIPWPDENRAVE